MPSETAIVALVGILLTAIVAPAVTLFLNRNKDGTALAQNALTVANQAVADLKDAKAEIKELRETKAGPFHVHLTITLDPFSVKTEVSKEEKA